MYIISCHKAVYCCLECHVPIGNICPVIEGVSRELACLMISSLLVLSSVSYCAYDPGVHAF